jgi:Ulp1 family protease
MYIRLVDPFEMVRKWHMKVPRQDNFKLKNLFIPTNIDDYHWTCIVIYVAEKRIEYFNSDGFGTGDFYLKIS